MTRTTSWHFLLASTVLAAAPVHAQEVAQAEFASGDEIIVTAQRRSENLQKVPIAVTAVGPSQIEELNLITVENIKAITPNMTFNTAFGFSQLYIRGIGSNFTTAGLENAVATYVDGAYLQRASGVTFDLLDISTVQVLKGPQGTLYGRNATGGAMLLQTADPTDELSISALGEYGRFDHFRGDLIVNVPLSETLAFRFAGRYSEDGNYVHNIATDSGIGKQRTYVLRGKLRWAPTSDFSAILSVEHSDQKGSVLPLANRLSPPLCAGCAVPGSVSGPDLGYRETDLDYVARPEVEATNINLRTSLNAGVLTIETVTAYRDQDEVARSDQDYSRADIFGYEAPTGGKTFTQDVTVSTDTGDWYDMLFGASYLHDKGYYYLFADGAGFREIVPGDIPRAYNDITTESVSMFAEVSVRPIERLTLTAGGRYSYDQRHLRGSTNVAGNIGFGGGSGLLAYDMTAQFSSFTPRFVATYDADIVSVYGSYSEGFKAGGFTSPAFMPLDPVRPENIKSYEIGAKFVSPDRRLRANIAAFYYKYNDMQVTIVDVLEVGGGRVTNAAKADGKGVEFDAQFRVNEWLQFFGGASYLDAKYKSFPDASVAGPVTVGGVTSLQGIVMDLSGYPLARAPKVNAFLGAGVNAPIGNDWKVEANGVVSYTSSFDHVPGGGGTLHFDHEPKYIVADMSASIGPEDDSYKLGFYVNNIFNEKYAVGRQTSAPFGAYEAIARPRTFGVRAQVNFKP